MEARLRRDSEGRMPVHVFLDESGTTPGDAFLLAGATAYYDVERSERAIRQARDRALGNASLWTRPASRTQFATTGFHFTEDNESVRGVLLSTLETLEFRAYCAYSGNAAGLPVEDRLINMYALLLKGIALRYRDHDLVFVFEENSALDRFYSRIWGEVEPRLGASIVATVLRGTKAAPCLAVTDYVLGVTRLHVGLSAKDFEERRFAALGNKLAYLIDFDDDRHYGGARRPIL